MGIPSPGETRPEAYSIEDSTFVQTNYHRNNEKLNSPWYPSFSIPTHIVNTDDPMEGITTEQLQDAISTTIRLNTLHALSPLQDFVTLNPSISNFDLKDLPPSLNSAGPYYFQINGDCGIHEAYSIGLNTLPTGEPILKGGLLDHRFYWTSPINDGHQYHLLQPGNHVAIVEMLYSGGERNGVKVLGEFDIKSPIAMQETP